ncbi:hypothetical protein RFI_28095 [Reticulomyxa filosa]|uniref:Guanylate cyclase domain-containing protein n=1 Tax=Reticulomyxa filosa TaxID=46433 RepID=X6M5T9_RETFI|nr:hypothetical protein RFI_28095 [Reticulomyxa filosa]|eukprot:ETO09294.1 hypothetical protein RFI_28095 [Reticulomyxa filosa]
MSIIIGYKQEKEWRRNIVYQEAIEKSRNEREQSTSVLLPQFIAKELLSKPNSPPNCIPLLLCPCSTTCTQNMMILLLNSILKRLKPLGLFFFPNFFDLIFDFLLKKKKKKRDAYICVSFEGLPESVLQFALSVLSIHNQLKDYRIQNIFQPENVSDPINIHIRIGIAHGYVLGCILGRSCLRFHIFGKALNHAIELEGKCLPNSILGICVYYMHITKEKCQTALIDFKKHDTLDAYWVTCKA